MSQIKKIITHPHFQADTLAALAILAYFGESKYPGISEALIEFWPSWPANKSANSLEEEGILALDMGGGKFDHHRQSREAEQECLTDLVVKDLVLEKNQIVDKLRRYAKRDDLEGKGTISQDQLDRAFGLSGLIQNLNRRYVKQPQHIVSIVLPLLEAHLWEEEQRHQVFPAEYERAQQEGRLQFFDVYQGKKIIKVAMLKSDVMGMVGFLRVYNQVKADVVVQRLTSGHTNIITKQDREVDLKGVAAVLRIEEARKKKLPLDQLNSDHLFNKGKITGIEEWYFDTAANSVQNGGIRPESALATRLSLPEIKVALEIGLNPSEWPVKYPDLLKG